MAFRAFEQGVNVITIEKEGKFYAMTAAWAMMIDYDCYLVCIGEQSETGKVIREGDVIGISGVSEEGIREAIAIGRVHSSETDKKKLADFFQIEGAYVMRNAKTRMACTVKEVIHMKDFPGDSLVYCKLIRGNEDDEMDFISYTRYEDITDRH